jgi:uncharacterized protein YbaR (Trm112 family)
MQLDPALLEILACPSDDHAPLRLVHGADGEVTALECTVCRTRYPVRDDIPILLIDEAEPGPNGIGVPAE